MHYRLHGLAISLVLLCVVVVFEYNGSVFNTSRKVCNSPVLHCTCCGNGTSIRVGSVTTTGTMANSTSIITTNQTPRFPTVSGLKLIIVCRVCAWDAAGMGNHLLSYRGLLFLAELFPDVPIFACPSGANGDKVLNEFLDKPFGEHKIFLGCNFASMLDTWTKYANITRSIAWIGTAGEQEDKQYITSQCTHGLQNWEHGGQVQLPLFKHDIYTETRDAILKLNRQVIGISSGFHMGMVSERRFMLPYNKPPPPVECGDCLPLSPDTNSLFLRAYHSFGWKQEFNQQALKWTRQNLGQDTLPYAVFFRRNMYDIHSCEKPLPWVMRMDACTQSLDFAIKLLQHADRTTRLISIDRKLGMFSAMTDPSQGIQSFTVDEISTMETNSHGLHESTNDVYLSWALGAMADIAYLNEYSTFSQQVFAMRVKLGKLPNTTHWY